ncbi:MAG: RAMP superfamily CRISPR-associated protein [Candidatus Wallbacteria bacterium]
MKKFDYRINFKGTLVFLTSYFSASTKIDAETDTPLLKSGNDMVMLSGSTITGKIKNMLEKIIPIELLEDIFGSQKKSSRLTINDSLQKISSAIRHGVVINRDTLAAQNGLLYDRELTPPYARFPLSMQLCSSQEKLTKDLKVMQLIKQALENCFINFGGGSTRGCGFVKLESSSIETFKLSDNDELAAYLANEPAVKKHTAENNKTNEIYSDTGNYFTAMIHYTLKFDEGVITAGEEQPQTLSEKGSKEEADLFPYFMTTDEKDEYYIIPGSSIKGVLRNKAEDIYRHKKLSTKICAPGNAGGFCNDEYKNSNAPENLCECCKLFGANGYASKVLFSDLISTKKVKDDTIQKMEHVAIDRFTGGSIESAKFDETVIQNSEFHGMITVNTDKLEHFNILAHLALEMADGKIRIGHSTRKGFGKAMPRIDSVSLMAYNKNDNAVIKELMLDENIKIIPAAEFISKIKKLRTEIENKWEVSGK